MGAFPSTPSPFRISPFSIKVEGITRYEESPMKKRVFLFIGVLVCGLAACDWFPYLGETYVGPGIALFSPGENISSVAVPDVGEVDSVDSILLTGLDQDYAADVTISLRSPGGRTITLLSQEGKDADFVGDYEFVDDNDSDGLPRIVVYDDGLGTKVIVPEKYQSEGDLDEFSGGDVHGTWKLVIYDTRANGVAAASLASWTLKLRYSEY
jgi:subtilisin-like proprotein convertase family protein